MHEFVTTIALIGIVIVVASLLSGALERSGLPVVAVFLGLGALLGPLGLGLVDIGFASPSLRVLATLGLALLLFSDAVTLETTQLRGRGTLLLRILGPGTLVPAALMALAAWWLLDLHVAAALIIGAALASTDPVLLRSVLRSRALPEVPRVGLRIETGMNDAVLLPIVILAMLALHAHAAPGDAVTRGVVARSVLGLFVLGPALGALVGWAGIRVLVAVRDRVGVRRDYESLYAIGLAFSAFAAAEAVGGSGFVAAFVAGLLVAAQDVELCDCFLEYGEATSEMLLLLTFVALGGSLIWTGLLDLSPPTLLFVAIALVARTVVLIPVLVRSGVQRRDRQLIALFGPRGLSSLLLVLLPVFAGVPGAERLFGITCTVVLASVLLHGGGIALYLRAHARRVPATPASSGAAETHDGGTRDPLAPAESVPDRITLDQVRVLQSLGEQMVLVDARAERNYHADPTQAAGAVRMSPDDPVRDATALRLSQRATLVVYCA
jgi:NhaP-type Na+/H+ or K+/H+ antiporter